MSETAQKIDPTPVLLEVTQGLVRELRPASPPRVQAQSRLDRDLGLDSLTRVELLDRVERACGVRLDARAAADARTVADLVRLVAGADRAGTASLPERVAMPGDAMGTLPTEATTLIEVLDWHAQQHPDRNQIWLYGDDDAVTELSFGALLSSAEEVAGGLVERGLAPRQAVALMLPTGEEFFAAFFGILLAGGTPVPLYPPVRPSQVEEHLRRQAGILRTAEAPFLITVPQVKPLGRFLRGQVPTLRELPTVAELRSTRLQTRPDIHAEDTAFLQFTSGSTGDPKGVVLSHANLLANMRVIGETVAPTPEDVFVSWLPLYHDMGLIGAVLTTWYHAVPLVLMSPLRFLMRPERWLRAIHRHRGSLSAAPNFAYELCVKKVPDEALETLDLSSWRMTLNGAEPISRGAMDRFAERFARCGYRAETMTPTYGLAECSLGVTMSPVPRAPRVDRIERRTFSTQGKAAPARPDDAEALEFVNCGEPLRGHEVRIVDPAGRELPERREGRIQFRGPSATAGYLKNPEATARLVMGDGWLESGDLGYLAGGELFVTGRKKDIIIRGGRNLYPHELEERVGELDGVRKGCVVVFGARKDDTATEQLVVVAETREEDAATRARIEADIRDAAVDLLGEPPDVVVLAPPHTVLKTSSGKVRRDACRKLYEADQLLSGGRAVWLQVARMNAAGWLHTLQAKTRAAAETAWATHFWTVFTGLWGLNWSVVAVLPGRRRRWGVARLCARAVLGLTGCKLSVEGALPADGAAVVVSNHQSYLDGMILAAVLPRDAAVVVKRELEDNLLTRVLMRRMGAILVDRFDATTDQAHLLPEALAEGRLVVVFPEGTCLRNPGLLPFQLGAFQAAAASDVPLIPLTIRGTRTLLRPDTWFPRRTPVEVEVGDPLTAEGPDFAAAVRLRDRARAAILRAVGEPDLAREDTRELYDRST